jgi:hypothetical protein
MKPSITKTMLLTLALAWPLLGAAQAPAPQPAAPAPTVAAAAPAAAAAAPASWIPRAMTFQDRGFTGPVVSG